MLSLIRHLLYKTNPEELTAPDGTQVDSGYKLAKRFHNLKKVFRREVINTFLMVAGVLAAGFGLKGFLLPNHFIDGGVTGISLLLALRTGYPLPLFIVCINIPFIILGFSQVGVNFGIKTFLGVIALSLCLAFIEYPAVTSDKLLVAVFGGFFVGAGIGLAVRGGGVLDGTEVLALYISRKSGLTIGDIILLVNILIFSSAAYFLTLESALYSILTYLSASKTLDFIIEGIEEYTGVTIISAKSEEIRLMIIENLGRGVTVYKGLRGFGKRGESLNDVDIVFTVITRLEISRLNAEIEKIDANAFVVMSSIKDTKGGMIKKRPLKR